MKNDVQSQEKVEKMSDLNIKVKREVRSQKKWENAGIKAG